MPLAADIARELIASNAFESDDKVRQQLADLCMHCELYFEAREIYANFENKQANDVSLRYKSGTAAYKTKKLKEDQ